MTFEEFAATRMPGVLRFAAVLAGDRATAEDLAQEVLIRAYARWDRIGCLDRSARPCSPNSASCPGGSARCSSCATTKTVVTARSPTCSAAARARCAATHPGRSRRCASR